MPRVLQTEDTDGVLPEATMDTVVECSVGDVDVVDPVNSGGKSGAFPGNVELDAEEPSVGILEAIQISYVYTVADVRRRPRNTMIGILAVFLLVFCPGVLMLGIFKTPYILLRLSEVSVGEMDVVLHSRRSTDFINFKDLDGKLQKSPHVRGSAPRWLMPTTISSENSNVISTYTGKERTPRKSTAANALVVDSQRERNIGLDRGWPHRLLGYGEAHLYHSAADYIGIAPQMGERFTLSFPLSFLALILTDVDLTLRRPSTITSPTDVFTDAFFAVNNISKDSVKMNDAFEGSLAMTMVDAIKGTYGKYPSAFGNPALLDVKHLLRLYIDQSCLLGPVITPNTPGYFFPVFADLLNLSTKNLAPVDPTRFAMMMVTVLEDRYDMYYADTALRSRRMVEKTNSMMEAIGLNNDYRIEFPVITALNTYDVFKSLLLSAFIVVVVLVFVFGSILLFTLLDMNEEEKQFELAMIRAEGMPRRQIICVLIAQTLAFTVPGTALGELLIFVVNIILEAALKNFTVAPANYTREPFLVAVLSSLAGLLLPLLATWGPVRRALGGTLRDALDVYRQVQAESRVVAIRLEKLGLELWQIWLGIFLVVAGFMTFYLMPLSFIFQNMMLFFLLLDVVLLFLVFGLSMMMYVIQPHAESLVLFLLLWGPEKRLKNLIEKNLRSHQRANAKVYMLFLLSVGCLSSLGVMFTMLTGVTTQLMELTMGSQVTVTSRSFFTPLHQSQIDSFLRSEGSRYASHWGYTSFPLSSYPQIKGAARISNFVGTFHSINVAAVSKYFTDCTFEKYNMVDSYRSGYSYPKNAYGKKDAVRSAYNYPPSGRDPTREQRLGTGRPSASPQTNLKAKEKFVIPILIASAAKNVIGLDVSGEAQITFDYTVRTTEKVVMNVRTAFNVQPRALMKRVSGFISISSQPLLFHSSSALVPEHYFLRLLNPIDMDFENSTLLLQEGAVTTIHQRTLFVRLHPHVSARDRAAFVNALQAHTNHMFHSIVDTQSVSDELKKVERLIMYLFYFSATVCIIICAFMTWVTFITNVQINLWSFGVLRAIGFRTAQLVRSAIYEALSIVLSAFFLGMATGVIIGLTMALQLSFFLTLPFTFIIPYVLVIIIVGLALIAAVVGSTLPFWRLHKKSISNIIRGL